MKEVNTDVPQAESPTTTHNGNSGLGLMEAASFGAQQVRLEIVTQTK